MRNEKRWLIWNGFYDVFGTCNQGFASINTNQGVRARLRWLGFYRGDPFRNDQSVDTDLSAAIKDFKAFPDTPAPIITDALDDHDANGITPRAGIDTLFN